jgi:hypothetical protein
MPRGKGSGGAGAHTERGWPSWVGHHWLVLPTVHVSEYRNVISMQTLQIILRDCVWYQAVYPVIGRTDEGVGEAIIWTVR